MFFYYIFLPVVGFLVLKKVSASGNTAIPAPVNGTPKSTATASQKSGTSANQPQAGSTVAQMETAAGGLALVEVSKGLGSLSAWFKPSNVDQADIDDDDLSEADEDIAASSATATADNEDYSEDYSSDTTDWDYDSSDYTMDA